MIQFLLIISPLFFLGCSDTLTCHCLNNDPCNNVNASCPGDCERGWYGPGCQIGNLAFNKPAFQSTTYASYSANYAVNGIFPPQGDETENNCSHTSESSATDHWWYVILSDSEDFVIKNITIVNRQGIDGQMLRKFYILYTSDGNLNPDPRYWKHCAFINLFQSSTVATYTCNGSTAIGRRVAIYLVAGSMQNRQSKLILCEVYVDGFSYNATALYQISNTTITSSCESYSLNFSSLSIIPPINVVVQFRNNSESNVSGIMRLRYNTNFSLTVPAMANRTYIVSVAPEICCIGSECMKNSNISSSKCTTGPSSMPVIVTTLQYRQYTLRKFGKVLNITSLNDHPCFAATTSVQCLQSQPATIPAENCSSTVSCSLDPRYSYMCTLTLSYSDGFVQSSSEKFVVSTADFATVNITGTVRCNSLRLVVENITARWDVAPSFVIFYAMKAGSNETQVAFSPVNDNGEMIVELSTNSDYEYKAWALPITILSNSNSNSYTPETFNKSCNETKNCLLGRESPVMGFTTLQRKYILKTEGCCASFTDVSSAECDTPTHYKISCASEGTFVYEDFSSKSGLLCGLKTNTNYSCTYTLELRSGLIESYNHFFSVVNLTNCSTFEAQSDQESTWQRMSASIGGSIVGVVLLIGVIILVVILHRRRIILVKGSTTRRKSNNAQRFSASHNAYHNFVDTEVTVYGNTCGMDVEEFERYSQNDTAIAIKFSEIRTNEEHPCTVGLQNTQKNRFRNVVPYDFNRVPINGEPCNYINASYINGYNQDKKYIATQGPISQTITDFWKMVWQQNVTIIVMLTDYVEQSKRKCDKYFPRTGSDTDGISVDLKSQSFFDTHCHSTLALCHEGQIRAVQHLQFLAWPDKSVPEHCSYLLMFYLKTRELITPTSISRSPIIVHCSAGVGRTGAFIALDYQLDRYLAEGRVDVDSCVLQLRDQRMHMVQTKEQYIFLHKVLLFGLKTFKYIRNIKDLDRVSLYQTTRSENFIEQEFKILQATLTRSPEDPIYMAARSEDNLLKNRNPNILAGESTRPFLLTSTGVMGGYINAVYCNGCYARNSYIVTQWPLKNTIPDFWELVYDCNPICIIQLHHSPSLEDYPEFYPHQGQSFTAGQFAVTNTNFKKNVANCANEHELSVTLLSRRGDLQDSGRSLRILECDIFDLDSELPKDMQQTASFIMSLQLTCKQTKDRPVIVVCKDGATFCGLFVAATNSLHRLIESNQVQIFHTLDLLRASRQTFINSLEQYECLYQLTSFCTEENAIYANMKRPSNR